MIDASIGDKITFKLDPDMISKETPEEDEYCELYFPDGRVFSLGHVTMAAFDGIEGTVVRKVGRFFGPEGSVFYAEVPVKVVVLVYNEEVVRVEHHSEDNNTSATRNG